MLSNTEPIRDLTDAQFHDWKIISFSGYTRKNGKGNRKAIWLSQCLRCNSEQILFADQLLLGVNPRCKMCNGTHNGLINIYKHNAKLRNLEFTLTNEQALSLFQGNCQYCGKAPYQIFKQDPYQFIYNGIDRVDNTKGYSIDNCVSCCGVCNKMKSNLTLQEFKNHILAIYKTLI